jgi:anti-anti-sigma regulatory factor
MSELYNISVKTRDEKPQTCIIIKGDLTLKNISAIKTELAEIISKKNEMLVKLIDITAMDLSFIQLLSSLKKNKKLVLEYKLNKDLEKILKQTGIKLEEL